MNQILSMLPGFSQASMLLNALGLTKTEKQSLNALYSRIRTFPGFRAVPEQLMPATFESLITLVLGSAKFKGGEFTLPSWLHPLLSNPVVRQGLARELANLIDSDPGRQQLLSAIGKTIKVVTPDVDPSTYPGLPELIDGLVVEKLLTLSETAEPTGHVVTCRACRFQQYMAAIPPNGIVECRACGHLTKVHNHD